MGLPRLTGKALNTGTIYLYRSDSMAGWFYGFPPVEGKGYGTIGFHGKDNSKWSFSDNLGQEGFICFSLFLFVNTYTYFFSGLRCGRMQP
jgi:hypothetical protein